MLPSILRKFVRYAVPGLVFARRARSQHDGAESSFLLKLATATSAHRSFIEIGFDPFELNSADLIRTGFRGLLLDADHYSVRTVTRAMKQLRKPVVAQNVWVTRENLGTVADFLNETKECGVLSIDIDGQDYWICKEVLSMTLPDIVCVEYNASLGLRPISVPYAADFSRHERHSSGWYHSASITAFVNLLADTHYLVGNIAGLNLVFLRKPLLTRGYRALGAAEGYQECEPRNAQFNNTSQDQWIQISHLPFVDVG